MAFELFIAGRYLKAKRKEGFISLITFLSIAGVSLGVMALVVVIAVMSGAETDFRKRILGLEPHILVMNYTGKFDTYSKILNDLNQNEQVKGASPILFAQAMIRSTHSFSGVMIRGIDPETGFSLVKGFSSEQLKKSFNEKKQNTNLPGIILGQTLASSIGVIKGDKVILMSPNGFISPMGHLPSMKRFIVAATFDSGMYEYDSSMAYVHLKEAQQLSNSKNQISAIGIWIDDVFKAKSIKESLTDLLKSPFYLRDWMDINKSLFSALKLEKTAMFIILTLIILVAAFNIASALIMMVMEKTKDIAVLKAMGATNRTIRKIFIIQGMIIGFLGTFLGTLSGIVICFILKKYDFIQLPDAYPFSTLPVQLEYLDVLMISISAIIICFFSTLYPSYKASKMDPVEAIRYG
ncbi:MAG: lipoprotein-releasing ABC transporter permease subunit [Desulfobacula sp.]|jgi:lipoprotein-releasing system permease protein|uniref:lipoprotein-releasing ABC transporter permease subunit n=1 Tax=Desulfobacula sp. TaxID=2593537 RepID=UPI001D584FD5|nr:lipoprotein-releasing ABC transporter permease subunit [Desulfobacula sp.]MBT3484436.1 lipoprotein-releasing ABC transporter permease subunit [Desulfobacula sp.]MBT3803351.1 lipoprotein-releasing ABC transporter permease subunit [Desulfobacula sp.]MBT4023682.1 lipoprotein-releasing ABC transporter permease subunit [Desulfobacula sp.]MBT4197924.1 lipoprotein-releasing ABC transporter permease subunit [Desulfobacula sp.]